MASCAQTQASHATEPVFLSFVHGNILQGPVCPQRTDYTNEGKPTEGLSFTRKQEQQHEAEKFEEPAETTQNLPPYPSHHYALDTSSLLVHLPQWTGSGLGNTQKERRGLKEPRLGIQRTWDSQSENKIFLEILYRRL